MASPLSACGYSYVPGPSGELADWVLRQLSDTQKGFEWRGQEDYDALGAAVLQHVRAQLVTLCGLEEVRVPTATGAAVYATPGLAAREAPLLLLVCGSAPGGAVGVWGRSLCINGSLREGAMFEYIFEAQARGWSVVVADPNISEGEGAPRVLGSECPHVHLRSVWDVLIAPAASQRVLIVAHSYGGPASVHLLKVLSGEQLERVAALAFTDGMAWSPKGWGIVSMLQEVLPSDEDVASAAKPDAVSAMRAIWRRYAAFAPAAFEPPSAEVQRALAARGRNFVASPQALGVLVAAEGPEGCPLVSAGHESHPSTTHAAMAAVFDFLARGAAGTAAAANAEVSGKA